MKLIQKQCHNGNINLVLKGLALHTFGNVSSRIDKNYFTIKPSGANLQQLKYNNYPIIRISDNKKVKGKLKPSSDTPTHSLLYKMYSEIGSIAHTHSKYATAWSQAKKDIPILGTTHADYCQQNIPVTNFIKKSLILKDYEKNTGFSIISCLKKNKLNPLNCPGVLVANHGPFCWGSNTKEALKNAEILEYLAELAYLSLRINPKSKMNKNLTEKHYSRKHGKKAYYGQNN